MILDRVIIFTKTIIRIRTFLDFPDVITLLTKIRNALDIIEEFVEAVIAFINVIKYVYIYVAYEARN